MKVLVVLAYLLFFSLLGALLLFDQPAAPDGAVSARFDTERAMSHLREIDALTRRAGGRQVGSPGSLLVRDYVRTQFEASRLTVYEQGFGDMFGGAMTNVIGVLPGVRDETILICAHHDAEGPGPAAVAGAAGLAVLVELARALEEEQRAGGAGPKRSVLFVAWDGETFGCAGSNHFVSEMPEAQRARLRAVVSLDSIGWKDGTAVLHVLPYQDKMGRFSIAPDWLVTRVANAGRRHGTSLYVGDRYLSIVYQVLVRSVDIGYYSDDRSFLARGVPSVFISNFSLTSSYPRTNSIEDTIDQVSSSQIAAVGLAVEAAVGELAGAEGLPAGETDYLVVRLPGAGVRRITGQQIRLLALMALLPGALALLRRTREGGLTVTRMLFLAFATILAASALISEPLLLPVLFIPAALAGPLLAIPHRSAIWAYLLSLIPPLAFAVLLVPVYVAGSARLVRIGPGEMAAFAALTALGLVQAPLQRARGRAATLAARV